MRRSKILNHIMSNVGNTFRCRFVFRMSSVHFWANYLYSFVQACFYFNDLVELFPESFPRFFLFILSVLFCFFLFFFSSPQSKDIMLIMTEKTWLNFFVVQSSTYARYSVQILYWLIFKCILDQEPWAYDYGRVALDLKPCHSSVF